MLRKITQSTNNIENVKTLSGLLLETCQGYNTNISSILPLDLLLETAPLLRNNPENIHAIVEVGNINGLVADVT